MWVKIYCPQQLNKLLPIQISNSTRCHFFNFICKKIIQSNEQNFFFKKKHLNGRKMSLLIMSAITSDVFTDNFAVVIEPFTGQEIVGRDRERERVHGPTLKEMKQFLPKNDLPRLVTSSGERHLLTVIILVLSIDVSPK